MISANLAAIFYLVSGILFILALRGLSSPDTSRQGNYFGIAGMIIAIIVTFFSIGNFSTLRCLEQIRNEYPSSTYPCEDVMIQCGVYSCVMQYEMKEYGRFFYDRSKRKARVRESNINLNQFLCCLLLFDWEFPYNLPSGNF